MTDAPPAGSTPLLIRPVRHQDARGWFSETHSRARLAEVGIADAFVQDNQSWSRVAGTVRGLHFQRPPSAQAKLVACLVGRIQDVIVDIRAGSPTFGRAVSIELSDDGTQLFVPEGFAHGFVTLTEATLVAYKVSRPYDPAAEGGIAWNDPVLGVDWRLAEAGPVVSDKDAALPSITALDSPFVWRGGELTPVEI